jgi:thiol-disulfide isomerase/thioredoxin
MVTSCTITINGNDYTKLNAEQRKLIKPFMIETTGNSVSYETAYPLQEINGNDIKECSKKYNYTWIYFWIPWCKGSISQLQYFIEIEKKYRDKGVKLLLVSLSYNVEDIKSVLSNTKFDRVSYILQASHYGQSINKSMKKVHTELSEGQNNIPKVKIASHYVFYNQTLIYCGDNFSEKDIQEIIAAHP